MVIGQFSAGIVGAECFAVILGFAAGQLVEGGMFSAQTADKEGALVYQAVDFVGVVDFFNL